MSLPLLGHDPREQPERLVSQAIDWVPALGCWCAFGANTICAILKSNDFAAADFAEIHRLLEQRTGMDCSSFVSSNIRLMPMKARDTPNAGPIWRG
jgi:hypothetical protein